MTDSTTIISAMLYWDDDDGYMLELQDDDGCGVTQAFSALPRSIETTRVALQFALMWALSQSGVEVDIKDVEIGPPSEISWARWRMPAP